MKTSRNLAILATGFLLAGFTLSGRGESRLVKNLEAGKEQTVVAYGTSLTAVGDWVQQLEAELNSRYPKKAKVINSGASSMASPWGVDNLDASVIAKKPDTVLIEFSINDAYAPYKISVETARKNLETMIDRILKANPDCEVVLMVMNVVTGANLTERPKLGEFNQMYRDVAKARKLLLVDHYPNWEKVLKSGEELYYKYVPDGLHPAAEGSKNVITPEIVKALGLKPAK